jgi:diguanylate cyclase (GGDEF)-like protein
MHQRRIWALPFFSLLNVQSYNAMSTRPVVHGPPMHSVAALIYWLIVAIWLAVLATLAFHYVRNPKTFGTIRLLLAVVAVDTVRNIFENVYFGLYFGGQLGLFPHEVVEVLGRPALLIVPKVLNVIAGCVVLGLLLYRWVPLAVHERGTAEQKAQDLAKLAAVDGLTGLYNRRHFDGLARAELARCQRYMRPLAILMLDVDHFKLVNDRFGHAAGDGVLRVVADVCRAEKRDSDIVGRIGGEEFALMLPETTAEAAQTFAERLRCRVRDCPIAIEGEQVAVTVSIGVAGASIRTSGIEALMRSADQALYDAKRAGRDQVLLWHPVMGSDARQAAE